MGNIILTGDRPTGRLHLGHYVGALKRRVEIQNEGDFDKMFVMIADAQALTDNAENPEKVHSIYSISSSRALRTLVLLYEFSNRIETSEKPDRKERNTDEEL